MKLTIVTPIGQEELEISWIEVQTQKGSLVIQEGHAPLLCSLVNRSQLQISLPDGHIQNRQITQGFLRADRTSVAIILEAV